jgi:hypothetical protein
MNLTINRQGMGIPAGTRLYPCPTHDLTGRVWVVPMDIKVYPYPVHASMVPTRTRTRGEKLPSLVRNIVHEVPKMLTL